MPDSNQEYDTDAVGSPSKVPDASSVKPKSSSSAEKPDISFGAKNNSSIRRPAPQTRPESPAPQRPAAQRAQNGQPVKKQTSDKRPADASRQKPASNDKKTQRPVQRPTQAKKPAPNGKPQRPPANRAAAKNAKQPVPAKGAVKKRPQTGQAPQTQGRKGPPANGSKPAANKKRPQAKPASAPVNGAAPKKKKSFTKKQALTIAGLILILLLILALVVFLLLVHYLHLFDRTHEDHTTSEEITYSDVDYSRPDTVDKATEDEKLKELSAQGTKISNKDVMNILLIAEDLRDTAEESAGNTDVMMIISINTKDKTITMTSVMRDCYVAFSNENNYWWSTRINAAYWYGGVGLTQQTIENYLNVKIDRYVLVNFNVFIDIVDALGGLDLYVSDEEANGYPGADPYGDNTRGMQNPLDEQNKYLHNKKGTDYIKKGGDLHLNGNQVLAYARLRHVGNADYERTQRQRKVISEMIKKSREMSLIEMDRLANKIFPQIKTDVTTTEMMQLLIDMLDYRNYELQEFRVPADGTYSNMTISGMDVLSVDFNTNAQMFRDLVYGTIKLEDDGTETNQIIE